MDGEREAAGGASRSGRLGGSQRVVPSGGNQSDAVLRRKKQLLGSAAKVFADGRESKPSAHQQRLEAENARLKSVVVEITAENVDLKKGLLD